MLPKAVLRLICNFMYDKTIDEQTLELSAH